MKTLQLSILMFFCFLRLSAQVAVAPPIVFCSPDHRFGDLIIENRTDNAAGSFRRI